MDPIIIKQLNKFREKRNISDYERAGTVTEQEAEEMIALANKIKLNVVQWLDDQHPQFIRERDPDTYA